jgi:hypothetical protein
MTPVSPLHHPPQVTGPGLFRSLLRPGIHHLDDLSGQAWRAEEAARRLQKLFDEGSGGPPQALGGVEGIAGEASAVNAEMTGRLSASFITPLDAEDVQAMSTALTKIAQSMRRAAEASRDARSHRRMSEVTRYLTEMVTALGEGVRSVENGPAAFSRTVEVLKLQREARAAIRAAADGIVREEDVLEVLAVQRLRACLDEALQRVRRAAICLQELLLKNG